MFIRKTLGFNLRVVRIEHADRDFIHNKSIKCSMITYPCIRYEKRCSSKETNNFGYFERVGFKNQVYCLKLKKFTLKDEPPTMRAIIKIVKTSLGS